MWIKKKTTLVLQEWPMIMTLAECQSLAFCLLAVNYSSGWTKCITTGLCFTKSAMITDMPCAARIISGLGENRARFWFEHIKHNSLVFVCQTHEHFVTLGFVIFVWLILYYLKYVIYLYRNFSFSLGFHKNYSDKNITDVSQCEKT